MNVGNAALCHYPLPKTHAAIPVSDKRRATNELKTQLLKHSLSLRHLKHFLVFWRQTPGQCKGPHFRLSTYARASNGHTTTNIIKTSTRTASRNQTWQAPNHSLVWELSFPSTERARVSNSWSLKILTTFQISSSVFVTPNNSLVQLRTYTNVLIIL